MHHRSVTAVGLACLCLTQAGTGSAEIVPHRGTGTDSPNGDAPVYIQHVPPSDVVHLGPGNPSPPPPTNDRELSADFVLTGISPEGDTPAAVAFSPDGARIVVAHRDTKNLVVFDAATREFLAAIQLSGSPNDVAIAADGLFAVTANVFEDNASIVLLDAEQEIAVVPVGDQPGVVRITPEGTTAVVGNTIDGTLSVIDVLTATEIRRISGTEFVASVSIAFESGAITAFFSNFEIANNTTLVHPDFYAGEIHIVDITTGAVTSLPCDGTPRGVAVTPDGSTAVVAHAMSEQVVSVVDVASAAISKTINVAADLGGPIAVNPSGTKAVVAVSNACRVVDLVTDAVSGNLNTASVQQLHTTADGNYVLTIGFYGSLIDYTSETIVNNLNNIVSTAIGAVSPTGPRGVMVANTYGEDMLVVNTEGASGYLEGRSPSGPPPEGDKARTVAISSDGGKALVASILSDNASIVDMNTLTVDTIVDVGDRPSEVAVKPDGGQAVIANLDSDFVSVIDLVTHDVTNVAISTRGSQVEISPDGQYAYIAVVTSDGVWRVNLSTMTAEGPKLTTGNMGAVSFLFNQSSGMTLSHDGLTLITCNSFDNTITLIDTPSWSVLVTLFVGAFPVRAMFSLDDETIYISNRDDGTITIVDNEGAFSTVIGVVDVGEWPFEMAAAPGGNTLYVLNYRDENVGVVDLATHTMTNTVSLPHSAAGLSIDPSGAMLHVASGTWSVTVGPGPRFTIAQSGEVSVINTASLAIIDQVVTDLPPAMLTYNAATAVVGVPSPFGDGLTVVDVDMSIDVDAPMIPASFGLFAPNPNPASAGAAIRFTLDHEAPVRLSIYDAAGRQVTPLVDEVRGPGEHTCWWDGADGQGLTAAPGVYFVRLATPDRMTVAKLVIVE